MSTKQSTVDFILEQMAEAGAVSSGKKMFGGYGLFYDGKILALVCDDELFIGIVPAGKVFVGDCQEKPPYQGAKPCFFISGEKWEDSEWLSHLVKISAEQLPVPKKALR